MVRLVLIVFFWIGVSLAIPHADETDSQEKRESAEFLTKISEQPTSVWMKRKLVYSQAIFRALTMGDLKSANLNAKRMKVLSKVEGFARKENRAYQAQLETFDRISEEISRQSSNRNIEGATLAFNQLTVNCVQCHQLLRSQTARQKGSENQ